MTVTRYISGARYKFGAHCTVYRFKFIKRKKTVLAHSVKKYKSCLLLNTEQSEYICFVKHDPID